MKMDRCEYCGIWKKIKVYLQKQLSHNGRTIPCCKECYEGLILDSQEKNKEKEHKKRYGKQTKKQLTWIKKRDKLLEDLR